MTESPRTRRFDPHHRPPLPLLPGLRVPLQEIGEVVGVSGLKALRIIRHSETGTRARGNELVSGGEGELPRLGFRVDVSFFYIEMNVDL